MNKSNNTIIHFGIKLLRVLPIILLVLLGTFGRTGVGVYIYGSYRFGEVLVGLSLAYSLYLIYRRFWHNDLKKYENIYLIILILYFIRIVFNGVDLYEVRQVAFFLNFTWLFFLERHFKWRSGWNKEMFLLITFLVMVSNSLLFYSESISLFFVGIFSGLTDKSTVFYRSSDFVIYSVGFASLLLVLKHKYSTLAFFSVMGYVLGSMVSISRGASLSIGICLAIYLMRYFRSQEIKLVLTIASITALSFFGGLSVKTPMFQIDVIDETIYKPAPETVIIVSDNTSEQDILRLEEDNVIILTQSEASDIWRDNIVGVIPSEQAEEFIVGVVPSEQAEEFIQEVAEEQKNESISSNIQEGEYEDIFVYQPSGSTVQWRLTIWKEVFLDNTNSLSHFLFGRGFDQKIPAMTKPYRQGGDLLNDYPHNLFVFIFARTGLIGLLAFFYFLYELLIVSSGYLDKDTKFYQLVLFLSAVIVGSFDVVFEGVQGPVLLFLWMGILNKINQEG